MVLDARLQLRVKTVFWFAVTALVPAISVEVRPPEVPEVGS
jgi:hypothetical protein